MSNKLLTQQDLAERWQVSVRSIENMRKEGSITPCKNVPGIRFTEQYIMDLEGIKLDRMSPLERRRLEHDIDRLKIENDKLKGIISKILAETSQIISMEAS